jgi:hypothetical protein
MADSGAPRRKPAARKGAAAKKTTARKGAAAKKPAPRKGAAAKKTTARKPPAPPERGRATVPGKTPAERGKKATAPRKGAPPGPTGRGKPADDKPGVLQRTAKSVAVPKPGATYHRWVLAEFIACLMMAVVGAVLSPRKRADGVITWASLIVQLTAISGVFFVLALLSAGRTMGKVAAAFGLLVTLGVLFNSTAAFKALAKMFSPPPSATGTGAAGSTAAAPTSTGPAAGSPLNPGAPTGGGGGGRVIP